MTAFFEIIAWVLLFPGLIATAVCIVWARITVKELNDE